MKNQVDRTIANPQSCDLSDFSELRIGANPQGRTAVVLDDLSISENGVGSTVVDLDGDRIEDISHGHTVASQYSDDLNLLLVDPFDIAEHCVYDNSTEGQHSTKLQLKPWGASLKTVAENLVNLLPADGREHVVVNISLAWEEPLSTLNHLVSLSGHPRFSEDSPLRIDELRAEDLELKNNLVEAVDLVSSKRLELESQEQAVRELRTYLGGLGNHVINAQKQFLESVEAGTPSATSKSIVALTALNKEFNELLSTPDPRLTEAQWNEFISEQEVSLSVNDMAEFHTGDKMRAQLILETAQASGLNPQELLLPGSALVTSLSRAYQLHTSLAEDLSAAYLALNAQAFREALEELQSLEQEGSIGKLDIVIASGNGGPESVNLFAATVPTGVHVVRSTVAPDGTEYSTRAFSTDEAPGLIRPRLTEDNAIRFNVDIVMAPGNRELEGMAPHAATATAGGVVSTKEVSSSGIDSSSQAFVTEGTPRLIEIRVVEDTTPRYGVDLDGNPDSELPLEQLSTWKSGSVDLPLRPVEGTSYAAPQFGNTLLTGK